MSEKNLKKVHYMDEIFDINKQNTENTRENTAVLVNLIRIEHPNCAVYRKTLSTVEEEITRTTLFTPEQKLHFDIGATSKIIKSNYVEKPKHLETLLFYFKDIKVSLDIANILISQNHNDNLLIGMISQSPIEQMHKKWCSSSDIKLISSSPLYNKCLDELNRIMCDEIECVQKAIIKYNIKAFAFNDNLSLDDINNYNNYYSHYYNMLHSSLEDNLLIAPIMCNVDELPIVFSNTVINGVI